MAVLLRLLLAICWPVALGHLKDLGDIYLPLQFDSTQTLNRTRPNHWQIPCYLWLSIP